MNNKPKKNSLTLVDGYGNSHIIHKFWEDTIHEAMKDIVNILRYAWFWEQTIEDWIDGVTLEF